MKVLTIITSVVLITVGFSYSSAQDKVQKLVSDSVRREQERLQKHLFKLIDTVKLSKVLLIQQEYKRDMDGLMADSSISYEEKRKKIAFLIDQKNLKVSKVLSPQELYLFMQGEPRLAPVRYPNPGQKNKN